MKTYAIRVDWIMGETFLIDATSLEEAIEKVEKYDNEVGIDLTQITEVTIDKSFDAEPNGEATEMQMKYCQRLEV